MLFGTPAWLWWVFGLTTVAAFRAAPPSPSDDCHQSVHRRRAKRIIEGTEVPLEDHKDKYHYVVGIKTAQTNPLGKFVTTRCTGTMLSARLLLTTAYCVTNPRKIWVSGWVCPPICGRYQNVRAARHRVQRTAVL